MGDWRFDEGAGDVVADRSGQGNDGEIHGAEWVRGKFGTALHFGGHDAYVTLPGPAGLDGSDALTVEAWVCWERGGRYPNLLSTSNWDPGGFLIFVQDNTCSFRMGKPGKASMTAPEWAEVGAGFGEFTPGRWYHLGATFARPNITTYLDGQPVGSARWDFPVGSAGDLQIGTWGNPRVCHAGLIGPVKLYTRALTAAEVLASYQALAPSHGPAAPGVPAYTRIPAPAARPAVVLENRLARLVLDKRARVVGLIDKSTGRDHVSSSPVDFVSIRKGGTGYRPTSCTYRDGKLTLGFGRSGVTATVKLTNRDRYFVIELLSVSDPEVEQVVLGSVAVRDAKRSSASVAWATDGEFATAVVPLNLQVEVDLRGGEQPVFAPRCVRKYGLVGARTALVACPQNQVRKLLQDVVRGEGLPYSPLGGPFALDAPENRGSYLFATISEANVDEWIALGRRGGFAEIHLCPWWRTKGRDAHPHRLHPGGRPVGHAGAGQAAGEGRPLHAGGRSRAGRQGHPDDRAPRRTGDLLERHEHRQHDPGGRRDHRLHRDQRRAAVRVHRLHARAMADAAGRTSPGRRRRPPGGQLLLLHSGRDYHAGGRTGRLHRQRLQHLRLRHDLHGRLRGDEDGPRGGADEAGHLRPAQGPGAGGIQLGLLGRVAVPLARRRLGSSHVGLQPVQRSALRQPGNLRNRRNAAGTHGLVGGHRPHG
ncbi:MAG: LamG domain-containing protein [Armatimonadetes bacterium]|nr:LamG domain-containing protein [Armatimonadota bacterium]